MKATSFSGAFHSTLCLIAVLAFASNAFAQQHARTDEPKRPILASTTQTNPRGTDVVEPALVYHVSRKAGGRLDSTLLGVAKIADPKKNEIGASVSTDLATGATIRLGSAWIYDESGLRRSISFPADGRGEYLVFHPGPHDDVVSLQGVEPVARTVGSSITFDLQELYEASNLHPITGRVSPSDRGHLRLALLRMQSTYPGGEAVDLNLVLAAAPARPAPSQPLRIVRRDTFVVAADVHYVVQEEVPVESPWTASMSLETGLGQAHLSSDVPATQQAGFFTDGNAGTFYLDGTLYLRRGESRWAVHALGISSMTHTSVVREANHQVALSADARFEHGTNSFVLAQVSGEINDKLFQEFDWNSADYAGEVLLGLGRRAFGPSGFERSRMEFLLGLRMGENRRIEVLEIRGKARGIGPYGILSGEIARALSASTELSAGLEARGYSIRGIGPRDEGFAEKGLNVSSDVKLGRAFLGVTVRAGVTAMWWIRRANLVEGMHYLENRRFVAPGISVETRL